MKPATVNRLTTAGLLLASLAQLGRVSFRTPGPKRRDPDRERAAEVKRMFRQERNLWIQSRGGYGRTEP